MKGNHDLAVPFADLKVELELYADAVFDRWKKVVANTSFINGENTFEFETRFAALTGANSVIGSANGTLSLVVALMSLGCNSESTVIVPANSFIATAEAPSILGASILFCDICPDTYLMDMDKLTEEMLEQADFIIPVHLYGQMVDVSKLKSLVQPYNVKIVEDAAQAHLAKFGECSPGIYSEFASYSFYPGKNLGAWGDAGGLTTNSEVNAKKARLITNHGAETKYEHVLVGGNFRISELQAAVLVEKLNTLEQFTFSRRHVAQRYCSEIQNSKIILPLTDKNALHSWHLFVVRTSDRDKFISHLNEHGVQSGLHYPTPLNETQAYSQGQHGNPTPVSSALAGEITSIPIFPMMTTRQIDHVIRIINEF